MSDGKKIARLLRKAADRHLWDGVDFVDDGSMHSEFSCCAVDIAWLCGQLFLFEDAMDHMRRLGVSTSSKIEFAEFKRGAERQGARYLWLHFAALVAEEDGA